MTAYKRELGNLFNRIGGMMLFFLLTTNILCGGAYLLGEELQALSGARSVYVLSELLNAGAYAVAFLLPVWFFLAISKNKPIEPFGLQLGFSSKCPTLSTVAMIFLGTGACFATSYANSMLFPISEEVSEAFFTSEIRGNYAIALMFISSAIIPALVEELLFRGTILSSIRPYSESGAVLISALLFGLMHQTPYQLFYTTALGVILGILRVKTGSIWAGVLVHFFNNLLSVIQSYLLERFDERTGEVLYIAITLMVAVGGILLGSVLYYVSRKKVAPKTLTELGIFRSNKDECAEMVLVREKRIVYSAFWSPTIIIYIVICVSTMLTLAIEMGGV